MNLKQYTALRIVIAMLLSAFIAASVIRGNFFWPIPAVATAFLLLFFFRQRVQEVIADERDFAIGGTAARWTIQLFSMGAVILMFILLALQEENQAFTIIATMLGYATCVLMLIYTAVFTFLRKRAPTHA